MARSLNPLAIEDGGTSATTPASARRALGIAEKNGVFPGNLVINGTLTGATSVTTPIVDSGSGALVLKGAGTTAQTITAANTVLSGTLTGPSTMLSPITNSLSGDVNLNNTANFFDGPSIAQGTQGTWFVSGTVTLGQTAGDQYLAKLHDGTTVIASSRVDTGTGAFTTLSMSGFLTSPAGNLRISVRDATTVNGKILANSTTLGKDSTITAIRIA